MFHARVAPSVILSVLIVVAAAVALYRPDVPPAEVPIPRPSATAGADAAAPPPTPGIPWVDPPVAEPEAARSSMAMVPAPAAPSRPSTDGAGVVRPVSRPAAFHSARSAFIRVAPGESLADVALRVYGTLDAAETLWSANRDQLSRPDQLLTPGTVLRTP